MTYNFDELEVVRVGGCGCEGVLWWVGVGGGAVVDVWHLKGVWCDVLRRGGAAIHSPQRRPKLLLSSRLLNFILSREKGKRVSVNVSPPRVTICV